MCGELKGSCRGERWCKIGGVGGLSLLFLLLFLLLPHALFSGGAFGIGLITTATIAS
jgi:hypothetical protein